MIRKNSVAMMIEKGAGNRSGIGTVFGLIPLDKSHKHKRYIRYMCAFIQLKMLWYDWLNSQKIRHILGCKTEK